MWLPPPVTPEVVKSSEVASWKLMLVALQLKKNHDLKSLTGSDGHDRLDLAGVEVKLVNVP